MLVLCGGHGEWQPPRLLRVVHSWQLCPQRTLGMGRGGEGGQQGEASGRPGVGMTWGTYMGSPLSAPPSPPPSDPLVLDPNLRGLGHEMQECSCLTAFSGDSVAS